MPTRSPSRTTTAFSAFACDVADAKAVAVGKKLVGLWPSASHLDTLAAAEAECGRFDEAVRYARQALAGLDGDHSCDRARRRRTGAVTFGVAGVDPLGDTAQLPCGRPAPVASPFEAAAARAAGVLEAGATAHR